MRGRIDGTRNLGRRRGRRFGVEVVEADHAVGEAGPEAAYLANLEHIGRHMHRELAMIDRADAAADDERTRADAAERRGAIGLPPQQRQRRGDQAGAQDAEQRQGGVDRIGHLQADDLIGLQAETAQSRRDRVDHAVGLHIGEAAWRGARDGRGVWWVDQRDGVGAARKSAPKYVVERRAPGLGEHCGMLWRRLPEDHCSLPHCAFWGGASYHHDSGKNPATAAFAG
jgi:hypothetical protein